jgi:hypothetical protein
MAQVESPAAAAKHGEALGGRVDFVSGYLVFLLLLLVVITSPH